jgi:predicted small lipoprotein YifL
MNRRQLQFILLPLLLLPVIGCGIKGPLRAKGSAQPAAPPALTIAQQGEDLVLSWQVPASNQDGTPLTRLLGFDVYRLSYSPQDYCEECRDPATPRVHIDLNFPAPATRQGDRLIWRDSRVAVGYGYRYRVIPIASDGQTGAAGSTRRVVMTPPPAPTALQIAPLDRGARITWQPPTDLPPEMELIGIKIYRALGEEMLQPIGGSPLTDEGFDDFGLINGQPYRYGLRSVVRSGDSVLESTLSELITIVPDAEL